MKKERLNSLLNDLPLGWVEYYETISSTNDLAAEWAELGAPDFSVVIADEQTKGRGRFNRKWFTPPGSALAFTVLLKVEQGFSPELIMRLTALGAVAVRETLVEEYNIPAMIKWPNDVLIGREKTCGVLAEAHWLGDQLQGVLLGIGVNVLKNAIPQGVLLNFPATSIQQHTDHIIVREMLISKILGKLLDLRASINEDSFIQKWAGSLAFIGEDVVIRENDETEHLGILAGLTKDGKLELKLHNQEVKLFQTAEIHLRPAVDSR